jgi:thioredoxin
MDLNQSNFDIWRKMKFIYFVLLVVLAFLVMESESKLFPWFDGAEEGAGADHESMEGEETPEGEENEGEDHGGEEGEMGDPTEAFSGVTELTDANFDSFVKGNNVFIEFYASWCSACRQSAPTFKKFASEWKNENVKIGKIDVDKNSKIANQFEINGIPTFYIFTKDGKREEFQENADADSFKSFIEKHVK